MQSEAFVEVVMPLKQKIVINCFSHKRINSLQHWHCFLSMIVLFYNKVKKKSTKSINKNKNATKRSKIRSDKKKRFEFLSFFCFVVAKPKPKQTTNKTEKSPGYKIKGQVRVQDQGLGIALWIRGYRVVFRLRGLKAKGIKLRVRLGIRVRS